MEHFQEYPISLLNHWFLARWEKTPLQQLLIHAPKIYALGILPVARNFTRSSGCADPVHIGQSKDGRVWERIRNRKKFLMQMYEREIIYKMIMII
jgi:hypothetical protein